MTKYDNSKTCVRCGLTSPAKYIRLELLQGTNQPVCVDEDQCTKTRAMGLPLPPPPPPPSTHQPGLVPPEHIETNKRAQEEKERMRWKDEEHRRKRLGIEDQVAMKLAPWANKEPVRA
jgi:hypothetical protein